MKKKKRAYNDFTPCKLPPGIDMQAVLDSHTVSSRDGCLIWVGNKYWSFRGLNYWPTRMVWMMTHPDIPLSGKVVVKANCNTRHCVEPSHLIVVSKEEHNKSFAMHNCDRSKVNKVNSILNRGEKNHFAKLTEEKVREIRASTASKQEIAEKYGIHPDYVPTIKTGRAWSHVV